MLSVFKYDNSLPIHDREPQFVNTVPFSKAQDEKLYTVSKDQTSADYYYYQLTDQQQTETYGDLTHHAPYFKTHPTKHIIDLDGDWQIIPQWLIDSGAHIIANSVHTRFIKHSNIFVRPTFSNLLMSLKTRTDIFDLPESKVYTFCGQQNIHRSRIFGLLESTKLPSNIVIRGAWGAKISLESSWITEYENMMKSSLLQISPRGVGLDTMRTYEICFYTRIPVIYGSASLPFKPSNETEFSFRILPELSDIEIRNRMIEIYNTPIDKLKEMAKTARQYFDTKIREYLENPTMYYFRNYLRCT